MDRFDYDRMMTIQINNGISYSPELIYHWGRKKVRELASCDIRDMISEMIFSYFVNNTAGLNPSNRYYVQERRGAIRLVRDRGEENAQRVKDFIITTSSNGNSKASKRRMTVGEMKLVDDLLTEHGINHTIRDYDQLKNFKK